MTLKTITRSPHHRIAEAIACHSKNVLREGLGSGHKTPQATFRELLGKQAGLLIAQIAREVGAEIRPVSASGPGTREVAPYSSFAVVRRARAIVISLSDLVLPEGVRLGPELKVPAHWLRSSYSVPARFDQTAPAARGEVQDVAKSALLSGTELELGFSDYEHVSFAGVVLTIEAGKLSSKTLLEAKATVETEEPAVDEGVRLSVRQIEDLARDLQMAYPKTQLMLLTDQGFLNQLGSSYFGITTQTLVLQSKFPELRCGIRSTPARYTMLFEDWETWLRLG